MSKEETIKVQAAAVNRLRELDQVEVPALLELTMHRVVAGNAGEKVTLRGKDEDGFAIVNRMFAKTFRSKIKEALKEYREELQSIVDGD